MLSSGDEQLFEVKAIEEDFHSWFVGQTVQRGWSYSSLQREHWSSTYMQGWVVLESGCVLKYTIHTALTFSFFAHQNRHTVMLP